MSGISLFIFRIRNSLFICVIQSFFFEQHFFVLLRTTNRTLLQAPFVTENLFEMNEITSLTRLSL